MQCCWIEQLGEELSHFVSYGGIGYVSAGFNYHYPDLVPSAGNSIACYTLILLDRMYPTI